MKQIIKLTVIATMLLGIVIGGVEIAQLKREYNDNKVQQQQVIKETVKETKKELQDELREELKEEVKREIEERKRSDVEISRAINRYTMTVVSTAYTTHPSEGSGTGLAYDGRPAEGHKTLAVDPKVIPLGSMVYVPNIGWMIAHDTGSAIQGRKVDICVDTREEAFKWGKKVIDIIVVPPDKPYKMNW